MAAAVGNQIRIRHRGTAQRKPAHTQATPVAQPASHDNALPEVPRDVAHFPDYKSTQQPDQNVHDCQEHEWAYFGYVLGCERRHDA